MNRSAGVTAVAIVTLLGSALAICVGILTGVAAVMTPRSQPAPSPAPLFAVAVVVYVLPGIWGLLSGIGLLRLKNWARISVIVFGALLILFGGFSVLMAIVMSRMSFPSSERIDPAQAASAVALMRGIMAGMAAVQIGIGVWFVVLLTRAKVAAQFTGPGTPEAAGPAGRPISITLIACLMFIGIPGSLVAVGLHSPVPFFLTVLTGLPATIYMIAMAGLLVYCGVGLLRLNPMARLVSIGYFVFGLANTLAFALLPSSHGRMQTIIDGQEALMPSLFRGSQSAWPFDPVTLISFSLIVGAIVTLVPLYFLVARKSAFESH